MFEDDWDSLTQKISAISAGNVLDGHETSRLLGLLIAAEDHRFHRHGGVDCIALIRACWRTIFCRRREGGSTIAMQLVRTLSGHYELTLMRKYREIILARRLNRVFGKSRILRLYLGVAYFGWNMHGVSAAAERLSISLEHATVDELAALIARLKYPEPRTYSIEKYRKIYLRQRYIIRRYYSLGIDQVYAGI